MINLNLSFYQIPKILTLQRNKIREKRIIIYFTVLLLSILMVFSGIQIQSFLNNENNKLVYSYNNETITFIGKNTYLGIGNALYPVE